MLYFFYRFLKPSVTIESDQQYQSIRAMASDCDSCLFKIIYRTFYSCAAFRRTRVKFLIQETRLRGHSNGRVNIAVLLMNE